jgi:nitrite reductase/ring-hydroxylating ferredoxin subunit
MSEMAAWALRPFAPAPGTSLAPLAEIPDGGVKEFSFGVGLNIWRMFALRRGETLYGYLNLCPHYSLPLNHRENEFMSRDGTKIMCRQHLALFRVEDGACLDGACDGRSLDHVPLRVEDGQVLIG